MSWPFLGENNNNNACKEEMAASHPVPLAKYRWVPACLRCWRSRYMDSYRFVHTKLFNFNNILIIFTVKAYHTKRERMLSKYIKATTVSLTRRQTSFVKQSWNGA